MLNANFKGWARRTAEPIALVLARAGFTPNVLTIVGFGLNVAVAVILALGHLNWGGVLLLVVSAFDMLDGALARAIKQTTRFGAFLDSTLDRYSEGVILLALVFFFSGQADQRASVIAVMALIGSYMVSYARARAEGLDIPCEVGLLARPERIIILGIGLFLGLAVPALAVVAILANFTAVQRILRVWHVTSRTAGDKP